MSGSTARCSGEGAVFQAGVDMVVAFQVFSFELPAKSATQSVVLPAPHSGAPSVRDSQ
jgi:hypothetical protein